MQINIVFQHIDPTMGGIENTAYYLYKNLMMHHKVRGVSMEVKEGAELEGVIYYPNSHAGFSYFLERNKWTYKNSSADKNVYNMGLTWFNAVGAYCAKKRYGTKYLCLVHGDDVYFETTNTSVKRRIVCSIKKALARKVLQEADVLCINSKYTQKLLHKTIVNKNEIIIHPGINFVELDTTWCKKDEFVIFSIGRHVERKGFQFAIQAMKEIKEKIPEAKYYLAGDGPLRKEFETLVDDLGLSEYIKFLGRIEEDEKHEWLEKCDVLLMPSFEQTKSSSVEGFGIVFVEANMAGRYVLGTNSGGISDAIIEGITGHLMEDSTPETIAKAVCEIYDNLDQIYTEESIEKRVNWAKEHSFENITKQYEKAMFGE